MFARACGGGPAEMRARFANVPRSDSARQQTAQLLVQSRSVFLPTLLVAFQRGFLLAQFFFTQRELLGLLLELRLPPLEPLLEIVLALREAVVMLLEPCPERFQLAFLVL